MILWYIQGKFVGLSHNLELVQTMKANIYFYAFQSTKLIVLHFHIIQVSSQNQGQVKSLLQKETMFIHKKTLSIRKHAKVLQRKFFVGFFLSSFHSTTNIPKYGQ